MKIGGKKVVDARKPLILYVNQTDINKGQVKDPTGCAIAQACKRQLHAKSAMVHLARTYVEMDDKWLRYRTPNSARTELVSFDRGKKFEEGVYKLPPLQPSKTKGVRQGGKDKPENEKYKGNTNARGKHHVVTGVRATTHPNQWSGYSK